MRILVFSDSHGADFLLRKALREHPEADMIIHLGDGERDVDACKSIIGNKKLIQVCGNCDFYSILPVYEIADAGGKKLFCTHGHMDGVKLDPEMLEKKARKAGVDILLYGHTHKKVTNYRNGLYIINPGSLRNGEYAAVDILPNGILCLEMSV